MPATSIVPSSRSGSGSVAAVPPRGPGLEQPTPQRRVGLVARAIRDDEPVQVGAQRAPGRRPCRGPCAGRTRPGTAAALPMTPSRPKSSRSASVVRTPIPAARRAAASASSRKVRLAESSSRNESADRPDAVALGGDRRAPAVVEVIRERQPAGRVRAGGSASTASPSRMLIGSSTTRRHASDPARRSRLRRSPRRRRGSSRRSRGTRRRRSRRSRCPPAGRPARP